MTPTRTLRLMLLVPVLLAATPPVEAAAGLSSSRLDFTSGDGTALAGMLVSPARPAAAGLVLLPGSGPATRSDFEPLAHELAARGIATLAFDKRGCGESGGSWVRASLHDLADDAAAALEALAEASGLDRRQIGLWGHSQGVWVATVTAARAPRSGFLIGVSGGGLSPREVELDQYRRKLEHAGLTDADRARGLDLVERYFAYLETGEGRDEIAGELETGAPWTLPLDLSRVLVSEKNRHHWSWVATFDPGAAAAALRLPVLLVFGENDDHLPVARTVSAWSSALAAGGDVDLRVRVFPGAGHDIRLGGHGSGAWAPGYLDLVARWAATVAAG